MSLLPTSYAVSPDARFNYVKNVSRDGARVQVSTEALGSLEVEANPAGVPNPVATITTAQFDNATLRLGSSRTTFQHLVLKDGVGGANALATFNTDVVCSNDLDVLGLANIAGDVETLGNLNLVNGSTGKAISGYYSATVSVSASGAQTNPSGLTQGVYFVVYVPASGAYTQQPSGVLYWSGTQWNGNAVGLGFTNPAPDCSIGPTNGAPATLSIFGNGASGSPAVPGTLYFRKIMN